MLASNNISLTELEFSRGWGSTFPPASLYQKMTYWVRSEEPEIQDIVANTERGLKIMEELHEANIQMKYYDLLSYHFRKYISEKVEENAQFSVLEIGTGHGYVILNLAKSLSKTFSNAVFFGLDINEEYINLAKQNRTKEGLEVTFLTGDANEISKIIDRKFDFILMSIFVHHLKPFELYQLLFSVVPIMNLGLFVMDINRDFLNIAKSKLFSFFNVGCSKDFKDDAIQSMRRAYTVEELEWLLGIIPGFSSFSVRRLDSIFLLAEGTK